MLGRVIDEVGHQYGRLIVLKQVGIRNGQALWLCQCNCGKMVAVRGYELRKGRTASCGCLQKERVSKATRLPVGEAAFNALVLRMKYHAKQRGYAWGLLKNQVRILTTQLCFYCGSEPSQREIIRPRRNGTYTYNGLDRIDNKKGYFLENVVPCCGTCNKAKNTMTQDEFLAWISRVYTHSVSKG